MQGPAFSPFDAAAVLLVAAAALGYLNRRFLPFSPSVGMTFMGAVASLLVVGLDAIMPGAHLSVSLEAFLGSVDFSSTLLNGMLCFLLFAGALHVDWSDMASARWPILVLSTISTIASTVLVAFACLGLSQLLGLGVSLRWCFVFGALISPTDPVAVFAVLKKLTIPGQLKATLASESLFNDGVAVVLFGIAIGFAGGDEAPSLQIAALDFVREAGGGALLGVLAGGLGYVTMRGIDDYNVEVMITLAVVTGGYALAHGLGVSGPVAMAVAGLIIGNAAVGHAMSAVTRDYLLKFWAVIDEVLNAVLFLLIGLEFVSVAHQGASLLAGAILIPVVLAIRFLSVLPPLWLLPGIRADRLTLTTLVWGGLRGGLSIAMALALGSKPPGDVILAITYAVVLFAVLIQGGTIEAAIERVLRVRNDPHDGSGT